MQDAFGRNITYLRLSVTELCNLRCRYCMPPEGIQKRSHEDMLTQEETLLAVKVAAKLGISKVRITGGEPLVKKNILALCQGVADTEGIEELCLTTNGTLLGGLADSLQAAGVRRINISLDTLNPDTYARITRVGKLSDALSGLHAALAAGFEKVKINAVLMGGVNDGEIGSLAELSRAYPVDVRFIELMPMPGSQAFKEAAFVPGEAVLKALPELMPVPQEDGVASLYTLPGAKGRVGLIRPLSCQFCGTCDRLRLTADGRIKPCLHQPLEYPIKGLSEQQMEAQFRRAIENKPPWHGELSSQSPSRAGRPMHRIGG